MDIPDTDRQPTLKQELGGIALLFGLVLTVTAGVAALALAVRVAG